MTTRRVVLSCDNLVREYRSRNNKSFLALDDVSLSLVEGEFVTIVGRSGSGKSTLLRILAGIEKSTSGSVQRADNHGDRVGMVFQGNSIFPWRTVLGNLTYSLESRGYGSDKTDRASELCKLVGLQPEIFLDKYPRELSGGEARRVAIGMALSADASLLLFDEPTSQLDYVSRIELQAMVHRLWIDQQPSVLYVTHDIDEAILLGQRVLVLRDGKIKDTVVVNLEGSRTHDMVVQPAFLGLRKQILEHLGH
jgi:NitT/TauT family transport system ATP-binding protein